MNIRKIQRREGNIHRQDLALNMDSCSHPVSLDTCYISGYDQKKMVKNIYEQTITHKRLSDSDKTRDIQLIFAQVQQLEGTVPFEHLREVRNPVLHKNAPSIFFGTTSE